MLSANDLLGLSRLFKLSIKYRQPVPGMVQVLIPVDDIEPISQLLLAESIRLREEESRL